MLSSKMRERYACTIAPTSVYLGQVLCYSYEEEYMVRLTNRRKSHDLGRKSQKDLEDLVDFSSFTGLTKVLFW